MTAGRIGITGWTGFLGFHVRRSLERSGARVALFSGRTDQADSVEAFAGSCGTVFHLAWTSRGTPAEVEGAGIAGMRNLAKAATQRGEVRIVFASSRWAQEAPDTPYGRGKLAAEAILRDEVAGRNGCSAAVLRLPNLYGSHCRPYLNSVVATFCWLAAEGQDDLPLSAEADVALPYIGVSSAVQALLAAARGSEQWSVSALQGNRCSAREWAVRVLRRGNDDQDRDLRECAQFFRRRPGALSRVEAGMSRTDVGSRRMRLEPRETRRLDGGATAIYVEKGSCLGDVFGSDSSYEGTVRMSAESVWRQSNGSVVVLRAALGEAADLAVETVLSGTRSAAAGQRP